MTWGTLRPVILLPRGATAWPEGRATAVLLHELAHVRRRDCLAHLVARLACSLYWFHPLAWLAAHRLRVEREQACDDIVLDAGMRPSEYAGHLLAIARLAHSSTLIGAAAVPMARRSGLEGRVVAILDSSRRRDVLTGRGVLLLLLAAVALVLPLSAARLVARSIDPGTGAMDAGDDAPPAPSATMTVTGRVLDPVGQPVPGAKIAVVGRPRRAMLNARTDELQVVLGRAESGLDGCYHTDVPRTSSVTYYHAYALAAHPDHGLAWTELNRDAESPTAEVRLLAEQPIEGRLVDLQGMPAGEVEVRVSSLGIPKPEVGGFDGLNFWRATPAKLEGVWPDAIRTDIDGRFRIVRIGRGVSIGLEVDDPRYARQNLRIDPREDGDSARVTLALKPALRVTGRVTAADTGEPLRDALVHVESGTENFYASGFSYRTDADGRYEARPGPGDFLKVTVYPAVGTPFPIFERNFDGNGGAARRVVDLQVPRGVLLTGRVIDKRTGRPLSGAGVFYEDGTGNVVEGEGTISGWMAAIPSDSDGRYTIAVMPGQGQLIVYGPTADFVYETRGSNELGSRKPGGKRYYAHAFVPYDVKPGQAPVEADVALMPGVTLVGRVEGPDGQAVDRAEIVSTLFISPFHSHWRGDFTIPVRDGRFEVHGVPPDRAVKASFLDARNGWGATLELSGAMALDGPLAVRLRPCGAAVVRYVDESGKPIEGHGAGLHIIANPGPGVDFGGETLTDDERQQVAADEEIYANVDRVNYWQGPRTGPDGRVTMGMLIPGATYRLYEYAPERGKEAYRWRDFTVEAGETLELGDLRARTGNN